MPRSLCHSAAAWLALAVLGAATPLAAQPRSLSWDRLAVHAHLDAAGRLHVAETQAMVFTGDWNGGERRFHLEAGQTIELERMVRIDPATGEEHPLTGGSVASVDGWDWTSEDTLRWRARDPSDPPFDHRRITYRLEYTLGGVLLGTPRGHDYVLDHEFAFADRDGPIEDFDVELTFDPVWRFDAEQPYRLHRGGLDPGESPVTHLTLTYLGTGRPAAAVVRPPLWLVFPVLFGALAAIALLGMAFLAGERRSGRYDPLPELDAPPDRDWLEGEVFSRTAEEIGALWDRTIGQPEVTALLARLVGEGKLRSRTEHSTALGKEVLHLELAVPRERFADYERELIDGLFFDGRTETDTEAVKHHYRSQGFDPAGTIRKGLTARLPEQLPRRAVGPAWRRWLSLCLSVAVAAGFAVAFRRDPVGARALLPMMAITCVPFLVAGLILAAFWRRQVHWPRTAAAWLFLPGLGALGTFAVALGIAYVGGVRAGLVALAAAFLAPVLVASTSFYRARTREPREVLYRRRRLKHVRDFFAGELTKPDPTLDDAWLPYLLAFGLAPQVEGWESKWAIAGPGHHSSTVSGSGAFTGGGGASSSWTGGGGAFGGAGATAAWAAAAGTMASGVAAPSSSGGGGGGGGGGGSSGGGGGGGW